MKRAILIFIAVQSLWGLVNTVCALPPESHPVLLYEQKDLPIIKVKVQREPYLSWWKSVLNLAESVKNADYSQMSSVSRRMKDAKALAFAYLMTDNTDYVRKAVELLESISPSGQNPKDDWGNIHLEVETVPWLCQTYDMVAGSGYLKAFPESEAKIRATIYGEADNLFKYKQYWYDVQKNNWQVRQYSALGTCAITLSSFGDGSVPQNWYNLAQQELLAALDQQITPEDGAWAEGPDYQRFSAQVYISYMLALKRFSGEDLLNSSKVHKSHDWAIKIRLPNGWRPNFDDASLSLFFGAYLTSVYPDGDYHRWDWESSQPVNLIDEYLVDLICAYNDNVSAAKPAWNPTQFMPDAGDAAFRSDWSPDATYMLLKAEHGPARKNGWGHEHPDATSFTIYADGEMLALDSGYINFDKHDLVNNGQNHNLILVDGQGPPLIKFFGSVVEADVDSYLENFFSTDFIDYAEVRTEYGGAKFRRSVLFPGKRYFIISDRVESGAGLHTYDWLLHGNGGGTSGGTFDLLPRGGRWSFGKAKLTAYVAAPENVLVSSQQNTHSFNPDQQLTHSVMKATSTAQNVHYLTALLPSKIGDNEPSFERTSLANGEILLIRDGESLDVAATGDGSMKTLPVDKTGGSRLQTDAGLFFAHLYVQNMSYFLSRGGLSLKKDDKSVFSASYPVDLTLYLGEKIRYGYVKGLESFTLNLFLAEQPDSVIFNGAPVRFEYKEGKAAILLGGEGTLKVYLRATTILVSASDFNGDGKVNIADFVLFAKAFGKVKGQTGFDGKFDLNGDGKINIADFTLFAKAFGKSTSSARKVFIKH